VKVFNVSWGLSAREIATVVAFEKAHCSTEFPSSRKGVEALVRAHLKQWGDQASYDEVEDDVDAAARDHDRNLFAEWEKELGGR